jgi:four helix bundle protein
LAFRDENLLVFRHYDIVTIRRFEEIEGWIAARSLASKIYQISSTGKFGTDFGLRDQIRKASISVMANIAEGFGRGGKAELIRFLRISHASALETQSHLYIAGDLGYLERTDYEALQAQVLRVTRLIGSFIQYLSKDAKLDVERKNQRTKEPANQEVFGRICRSGPLRR